MFTLSNTLCHTHAITSVFQNRNGNLPRRQHFIYFLLILFIKKTLFLLQIYWSISIHIFCLFCEQVSDKHIPVHSDVHRANEYACCVHLQNAFSSMETQTCFECLIYCKLLHKMLWLGQEAVLF